MLTNAFSIKKLNQLAQIIIMLSQCRRYKQNRRTT